ncbi:MAG: arginine N-succinyltransferase [Puniceicoccaceae bacterium]
MMIPEFVLRPVKNSDLPQLTELVRHSAGGMTTLPEHPEGLEARVHESCRAFDHRVRKPGGEVYLFVLEEVSKGRIIGTSGIISRVGGFDPFYTYSIKDVLQEYEALGISKTIQLLKLNRNHKGPSEICSLFLHPDFRHHGLGKLLSLSRFCFMKTFPERFDESVIAELRGYIDPKGKSPFWEAVGKKFFWSDYYTADILCGIGEKDFIEALMPEHPIYVNLLSGSARSVIGKVHPHTEPARALLLKEGFKTTDEIDIFDAGPILKARLVELASWNSSRQSKCFVSDKPLQNTRQALVTNMSLDFRATVTDIQPKEDGSCLLSVETAGLLNVRDNSQIQILFT